MKTSRGLGQPLRQVISSFNQTVTALKIAKAKHGVNFYRKLLVALRRNKRSEEEEEEEEGILSPYMVELPISKCMFCLLSFHQFLERSQTNNKATGEKRKRQSSYWIKKMTEQ